MAKRPTRLRFTEDDLADLSDRQLYKQAGNGVTVNVVEAIGRNLKAVDEELKLEDSVYAY